MAASSPPDGALPPPSSTPPPPIPSSSPPLISIPPPVLPPIPSPPIPDPPPIVPSSPPPTTPPPAVPSTPPPTSPVLPPPPPAVLATPPPTSPVLPPPPPVVSATPPLTSPVLPPPPPQSPPSPPILPPTQPPPSPLLVPPPKPSPSPPITPPSVTSPPPPAMVSPPSPETPSPPPSSSSPPRTSPTQPEVSPPPNAQPPQDLPTPPVSSPGTPVRLSPPPPANSTKPLPVSPPAPFALNYPNSPPTSPLNSPPVTVSNSNSNSGGGLKTEAIIGIGAAVVIIVLLGALIVWFLKSKKKDVRRFVSDYAMPPTNGSPASQVSESTHQSAPLVKSSSSQGYSYSPREPGPDISKGWFTYKELSAITDDFSSQNILGKGGFGCVYKGRLPDGRDVAVKQLKVGGEQGEREFQAEVEIISRVHHRHLVSLVGYCISENQRLLVYDYVPNNTLHYHLHGDGSPVMDWATRIKIAAGAARGIAYLHEDCHPRIIHRDIKSSNILLDNSFEALVSDFGLAKLTVDAQTHVTTRVMGTFGYMAPEYASSGKLTDRSDVFSFGVVLLELITGRKPVDTSQPVGDESLVQWARPLMSCALETGDFDGLPDPRLQGNHSEQEMFRLIEIAAACVRHSASMRPQMGVVMRALDNLNAILDLQNGVRPGQSELFNTGPNSEDIRIFNMMAFGGQAYTSDFSHSSWSDHREF